MAPDGTEGAPYGSPSSSMFNSIGRGDYRERRVIGYLVVEVEATKPAVRKANFNLLAQSPLGTMP
jgi:hypothetical protein